MNWNWLPGELDVSSCDSVIVSNQALFHAEFRCWCSMRMWGAGCRSPVLISVVVRRWCSLPMFVTVVRCCWCCMMLSVGFTSWECTPHDAMMHDAMMHDAMIHDAMNCHATGYRCTVMPEQCSASLDGSWWVIVSFVGSKWLHVVGFKTWRCCRNCA